MPYTHVMKDVCVCNDCGAHAKTKEIVKHFSNCNPGESEYWEKFYANEDSLTDFMWQDSAGRFYAPSQMSTHHLFYTIKMIWNHIVPPELQLKPFKKYTLSPPRFTEKYCKIAVHKLYNELMSRDDYWHYLGQLNMIEEKMLQWRKEVIEYAKDNI